MFKKGYVVCGLLLFISLGFYFSSCDRDIFTNDPKDKLLFSTDTLSFDTVFTSVGSATKYFVVKNSSKSKSILIDRIFLAKGTNSKFRINIDGRMSNDVREVEILPGDSIFIFVEVTIDPSADDLLEIDSVVFLSNSNVQDVKLVAFGQNVTLINGRYILNDTTWTAEKPILIYNSALIDTFTTVTIMPGAKIYFHRGSSLFVKGTIKALGEVDNRIVFTGDRLEPYYSEIAGQWGAFLSDNNGNTVGIFGGIHLLAGSRNSVLKNVDIKNAIIGLQVDSCVTPGTPTVKLINTKIENSKIIGLYALGANIEAENCVFANSGQYNVACLIGGNYRFIHCTMANYWVGNRRTPQLILNNYYTYKNNSGSTIVSYRDLTDAYFGNCIIYGSRENELQLDFVEGAMANFRFDNCLIRSKEFQNISSDFFIDNIWNENPKFKSVSKPFDYSLDTLSPAKDKAKISISNLVPLDISGNNRLSDGKPDLGAFERIE